MNATTHHFILSEGERKLGIGSCGEAKKHKKATLIRLKVTVGKFVVFVYYAVGYRRFNILECEIKVAA